MAFLANMTLHNLLLILPCLLLAFSTQLDSANARTVQTSSASISISGESGDLAETASKNSEMAGVTGLNSDASADLDLALPFRRVKLQEADRWPAAVPPVMAQVPQPNNADDQAASVRESEAFLNSWEGVAVTVENVMP
eukprot:TRINITY_DN38933_c0_g1_i1.p1 TRINITY_DN38933_c0_g1~~TRINITY_DN38933_c0_g1_i1.p1  ORF type:complete len:139 (+),score=15.36 TRINITY_DN38933_c0_g1_i1:584-1000(+)